MKTALWSDNLKIEKIPGDSNKKKSIKEMHLSWLSLSRIKRGYVTVFCVILIINKITFTLKETWKKYLKST